MTDINPYIPPTSQLGSSGGKLRLRSLIVAIVANCIALLVIGLGYMEALDNERKNPVFIISPALPVLLCFISLAFPTIQSIRGISLILGFFFCGLYVLVMLAALIMNGFDYPMRLIYPALLALALGVGTFALIRR